MCGIAGCVGFGQDTKKLLEIMNSAQVHRGPDGDGIFIHENVGIAQRSLAIIDRAHGQQPMHNALKSHVITFNGEIYNFQLLRKELQDLGKTFNNETDTEVVLQAYATWGKKSFDRLNGMFGLGIYDIQNKRLVLARDHFGIKPVYYVNLGTVQKPRLLFASEIKTLLATKTFTPEPNDRQIFRYLKFRIHEDERETFFKHVYKLLPGEMMVVDEKGLLITRYTDLPETLLKVSRKKLPYTPEESALYREKITRSIRMRLISEVAVGTCLSGGLDSSTIALTVNQLLQSHEAEAQAVGSKQNTFSAVFPGSINDEEQYIDAALSGCTGRVASHKIYPTTDSFLADLIDFVRTQEEPTISTGPYAQYKVMEEAHKHVTVLLDGQGADEMMAGYYPYYFVYWRQLKKQGEWLKLLTEMAQSVDVLFRFLRFRMYDALQFRSSVPVTNLLNKEFRNRYTKERFQPVRDNLRERFIEDIFKNSLPALLRYEDKNTMRFSLEGRVPFLDKDVMEYLFSLEDAAIIRGSWNKAILRDSMHGLLPDSIRSRRNKIGFTTPETEWFKQLQNHFYSIFTSESFARRPYFNQGAIVGAFQSFMRGRSAADTMVFWRLLNVELWFREFIDPSQVADAAVSPTKKDMVPNSGKQLGIVTPFGSFDRYPLQTDAVTSDTDLEAFVTARLKQFISHAPATVFERSWYLFISEKIVAISQGRSYFIWDVQPSFWARLLSQFVVRTPHGIGLGSPWTMELAIRQAGLPRVLYAAVGGLFGKLIGRRGVFYNMVGSDVRAIDGPTEYSVFPSNVSAKLPPRDPAGVASTLTTHLLKTIPSALSETFRGVIIIDANDLGQNVLGQNTPLADSQLARIFKDNPLGQGSERTPLCVVVDTSATKSDH